MGRDWQQILKSKLDEKNYRQLMDLDNPKLHRWVADSIELCKPADVFVCTDLDEDIEYIRKLAIEQGEEIPLKMEGHTVHFDAYGDQGRDKANTKYLVSGNIDLGAKLNTIDKAKGVEEVRGLLNGAMYGHIMLVRFFCLGPNNSEFSIPGIQITDSAYVAHSEDLLYRSGYEQFKSIGSSEDFFRVIHSQGRLDERNVSADLDKRRIYIDLEDELVYSVNTQYAGNTVGFKKLCLRLAIRKADRENWLTEHMLIMGVHGPNGRVTYFTGAFPSACGKTSTAMVEGETIVGDDLAYLRKKDDGVHAVNVESGVFGIINSVNAEDDPGIFRVLTSPGEVIFSNVLVAGGVPYWTDDGRDHPESGVNHSGEWYKGKKDASGNEIPASHNNARYTIRLKYLKNLDPMADEPAGVSVGGIIYGGRNSATWVPVRQSFDWEHGVITMGASLESETTAATLGKTGVLAFNPMSNLDFLSIPLGKYVKNHLEFGSGANKPPIIFAVNYFLKDPETGKYLNDIQDKRVWLKWMELRVHRDVGAIKTPVGLIPKHDDLVKLFKQVLDRDYPREKYIEQFKIRTASNLEKVDRVVGIYKKNFPDIPEALFSVLADEKARLEEARRKFGDFPSPFDFEEV